MERKSVVGLRIQNRKIPNRDRYHHTHHVTRAIMMARLHALRNNQDLARFVIEGESNGKQLGTGSYGSVEEVS